MLDPKAGRAFVEGNRHELHIIIPAKRNMFVAGFLTFWMCGWLMGELFALGALFTGAFGGGSLFLLVWVIPWTLGGLAAGVSLLWLVAGKERIHMTQDKVTVARQIPFWTRKTECRGDEISRLKLNIWHDQNPQQRNSVKNILSNRKEGVITFAYGVHTIGFGLELDEAEARQILDEIKQRFPAFSNGT